MASEGLRSSGHGGSAPLQPPARNTLSHMLGRAVYVGRLDRKSGRVGNRTAKEVAEWAGVTDPTTDELEALLVVYRTAYKGGRP